MSLSYSQAITYLTRCADDTGTHYNRGYAVPADDCDTCKGTNDAGHLSCPGSRYGYRSADVAREVYRAAIAQSRLWQEPITESMLDVLMRGAVNDSDACEELLRDYAIEISGADVDDMVRGYLLCQLWTQRDYDRTDDDGEPSDDCLDENYGVDDINGEYVDTVRDEFRALVAAHPIAVRMYLAQRQHRAIDGSASEHFGHDYMLTRNHHGAGFWDRGLGELGKYLTDIAHRAGEASELWIDESDGTLKP